MTIKRQWLIVLILSAIISLVVNSFVLSTLINRYFLDSTTKNYENHYEQIVKFAEKALADNYSSQQLEVQLETHLIDPITRIELYDANGQLLADVGGSYKMMDGMMNESENRMGKKWMNRMLGAQPQEVVSSDIIVFGNNGRPIGYCEI